MSEITAMMSDELNKLATELEKIDAFMLRSEQDFDYLLEQVHPSQHKNAVNLLHYLALRSLDIRELQDSLHEVGLSSMTSAESHIRGQVLAIQQRMGLDKTLSDEVFTYTTSKESMTQKSTALFGQKQQELVPYIMVTFDASLADDFEKVKNLLQSGMNIARINCAHDDESVWSRMIQHVKRAATITGLKCKIYMDLAGPKIRTVFHKQDKLNIEVGKHIYLVDQKHLDTDKATVGCTLIGIVEQLNPGESVLFDDGLIEARVEKIEDHRAKLQVLRISKKKPVIKAEKGINFPDSILTTPALTEYDKKCLSFIEEHADMVGYSFVRNNKDIIQLHEALGENQKLDLVIKIETPEAVKNLPDLLFCGMRRENVGVMIARGDLAVEIGFERMSEIQEEILWICEAAHVPVIWATQVLENLNKSGMATRSEVTDAAHAALADCVMINKGNYIIQTMETLRDILLRSGGHHVKKRYTFRPLSIAMRFMTR
ncbi:pyruvate kinase [Haliscomenobacter sp.]|uniref:pyruvate kinase n=1 Tax=Haliscomenobacter sp. TaxID=2717303 RepID=UPI003364C0C0